MPTALLAKEIFDGHEILTGKAVLIEDATVVDLVPFEQIPASYRIRHIDGYLLAPAFIDLQLYGGNGKLFSTELSTESLEATYEYCLQGGCTQFLITMATNSMEKFLQAIGIVKQYWGTGGKGLMGLHLEGPYLNPAKKGAHLEKFIKTPTVEEVEMLLEKGKGVIKMMTIAPEQCDEKVIDLLLGQLIVSAGHSNATYEEAIDGFYQGIPAATHLFNAMSPLQGREPGMVGAIFDHGEVMCSIVCDGVHVDFASVRVSKKLMQERLFFITDAVTEVTHGEYQHLFQGDRYTLPNGTLSGSCLSMIQCVKNGVEKVGIPLPEALRMASLYPATVIGAADRMGCIKSGTNADFVILDDNLNVRQLIVDGE